jgi:cytochrome c-type biogenesis protein
METVEDYKINNKVKKRLVVSAFVLFSVLLLGIFYLFMTPGETVNIAFAYIVGLSMIVLPCTLPLAFVIVPMAMGKGPKKGLLMSLFFGLGLSITLSIYGIFVAVIGKSIGLDQAIGDAGIVSSVLFMIGGLAAFIFGLSELNLIKFKMPTFKGAYPEFIQKQGDYLKAFFLGLFLGNAGVGLAQRSVYIESNSTQSPKLELKFQAIVTR